MPVSGASESITTGTMARRAASIRPASGSSRSRTAAGSSDPKCGELPGGSSRGSRSSGSSAMICPREKSIGYQTVPWTLGVRESSESIMVPFSREPGSVPTAEQPSQAAHEATDNSADRSAAAAHGAADRAAQAADGTAEAAHRPAEAADGAAQAADGAAEAADRAAEATADVVDQSADRAAQTIERPADTLGEPAHRLTEPTQGVAHRIEAKRVHQVLEHVRGRPGH